MWLKTQRPWERVFVPGSERYHYRPAGVPDGRTWGISWSFTQRRPSLNQRFLASKCRDAIGFSLNSFVWVASVSAAWASAGQELEIMKYHEATGNPKDWTTSSCPAAWFHWKLPQRPENTTAHEWTLQFSVTIVFMCLYAGIVKPHSKWHPWPGCSAKRCSEGHG